MNKVKFALSFVSLIIVALILLSYLVFLPSIVKLNNKDLEFDKSLASTDWFWEENTEDYSDVKISDSVWQAKVIDDRGDSVRLNSLFKVQSLDGELIFESTREYLVNKKTGHARKDVEGETLEAMLYFPGGVSKKETYDFWSNDASKPFEISYDRIEKIGDLEVYVFKGSVTEDLTESYSFEDSVPEERFVISEQDLVEVWIEPTTGILVNYDARGENVYHDSLTNDFLEPRNKWRNMFNSDTIDERARFAQNEKQKVFLIKFLLPGVLVLLLIALLVVRLISKRGVENARS